MLCNSDAKLRRVCSLPNEEAAVADSVRTYVRFEQSLPSASADFARSVQSLHADYTEA